MPEPVRVPRKPMPELADLLQAVTDAASAIRQREHDLEQARIDLSEAINRAHAAGASFELIGRLLGVSRQRVAQLAERG